MRSGESGGAWHEDERLDALVDATLREMARPPAVDLKPRVMAAWDERAREGTPAAGKGVRARPWLGLPALRPAAASVLVILAGLLAVWLSVDRTGHRPAQPPARTEDLTPVAPASPGEPPPAGTLAQEATAAESAGPTRLTVAARRAPRAVVEVEFPVELPAEDASHLPRAPGGELGVAIARLPGAPPIDMAPIEPTPTISEMSRPVSEFPAGDLNQPPGAEEGNPGQSGGSRR